MATAFAPGATPAPIPSTAKNNHAEHNQPIYNRAVGYLRAFIVMLVVAHHAALAYHPFAPPPPASLISQPRWWGAFPVVDSHKWTGAALLVGFNEMFFMSLMFLLSGLFVWHGLHTKGAAKFLRDRLLRLGLPFALSVGVLAPLAYYPAYLQTTGHSGIAGFLKQWVALGNWPAGPAWFIAVLLAFDCIAALLFLAVPKWGPKLGALTAGAERKPMLFFTALIMLSALTYMPMAHHFTVLHWTVVGPFAFQTSRILHYLVYFLLGVGAGAWGLDRGLLAPQGKLARRWPLWVAASLVIFAGATAVSIAAMASWGKSPLLASAADVGFVLSCAASCFAFLAVFLRFVHSRSRMWDDLAANSYGIYLFHYVAVNWMLCALVSSALPGFAKFLIVFASAFTLSWALAETIRRVPGVARVI